MSEKISETLKSLCEEILKENGGMNDDTLKRIEDLYEEALVAHYLEIHHRRIADMMSRVDKRLSDRPAPPTREAVPPPVEEKPIYGDEVKVLPHPEGPPKPQPKVEPKSEESPKPAPTPEPKKEDTPPPTPVQPVSEDIRKAVEERVVSTDSSNPRLNKLNIGLNDRIAFVKQLFQGSQEDYQRVISQINTMDSYDETMSFINEMVKPEYDWSAYEETEQRLLDLIAHRFNV